MWQTTRFSSNGITTLAVYKEIVHMDYFGQGVVIRILPRPEEHHPRGEFRNVRGALLENIDRTITREFDEPNMSEIRRGRERIKHLLSPLLAAALPLSRSPSSRPDPAGDHPSVAWSIYEDVIVLALRQTHRGRPCLERLRRRGDPSADIPEQIALVYPNLIKAWTEELFISPSFVAVDTLQGTVTFSDNRRFTCLASRNTCIVAVSRSGMLPMLSTLGAVNLVRASMPATRARSDLCVPRLHGYVYHRALRSSEHYVQLVGGLVDHMPGACCWTTLRGERWPGAERQKEWSTQLLHTLTLLHDNGLAWGGAVGCTRGFLFNRLRESVDIDDRQRPWLVRNYAAEGVSRAAAMESDRAAVEELRLILGVYALDG